MTDALALPETVEAPLLVLGDCLDVLARLPAESVDVVITDPPAGIGMMGKPWDSFASYEPRTAKGLDVNARLAGLLAPWAVGFVAFLVDVWSEVDRVLKPGGIVCAWALPKTADLAGLALRAALALHGSAFRTLPLSLTLHEGGSSLRHEITPGLRGAELDSAGRALRPTPRWIDEARLAASAAEASATIAAATTATGASALLRLVHSQRAAVDFAAVQGFDGGRRARRVAHLHEGEAARAPGLTIGDDVHRVHRAVLLEKSAQLLVGGRKGKVSYVDLLAQGFS